MASAPRNALADKRVALIGLGGLGCPAAQILAAAGVGHLALFDDDVVDVSNLQRQVLFDADDEGRPKVDVGAEKLGALAARCGHSLEISSHRARVMPASASEALAGFDLLLEGSDNFGTKFLISDVSHRLGTRVVHAGAVQWAGWSLSVVPGRSACLRCLFESMPPGTAATCDDAGVVGPVVGVLGADEARAALSLLLGTSAGGRLFRYEGLTGRTRARTIRQRRGCPGCAGDTKDLRASLYVAHEGALCEGPL